jgi:hypothetical protein
MRSIPNQLLSPISLRSTSLFTVKWWRAASINRRPFVATFVETAMFPSSSWKYGSFLWVQVPGTVPGTPGTSTRLERRILAFLKGHPVNDVFTSAGTKLPDARQSLRLLRIFSLAKAELAISKRLGFRYSYTCTVCTQLHTTAHNGTQPHTSAHKHENLSSRD